MGESRDAAENDGIYLWRSRDLAEWESIGLVWSLTGTPWEQPEKVWGQPHTVRRRAATAPELHIIQEAYWLIFSPNESGIVLLKSDVPQGPYEV